MKRQKKILKIIYLSLFLTLSVLIPFIFTPDAKCDSEDMLGWGVDYIDAERVWGGADGAKDVIPGAPAGQGVKVLVIDTGIYKDHDDLDDRYKGGFDHVGNDNDPQDLDGHGTWCSGVIAAEDNEKGILGVAPKADLYMYRVDSDGQDINPFAINNAILWAIDNDIDVISMSLGSPCQDGWIHQWAIEAAYNSDIVMVAATGNDDTNVIDAPACSPLVIAVGAVSMFGTDHVRRWRSPPDGSNYGSGGYFLPWPFYHGSHIDLVAPGQMIPTTGIDGPNDINPSFFATSCATPHVAGVCALLISQDLQDGTRDLSPADIKTILCTTAKKDIIALDEYNYEEYGHGLVNAYGACDLEKPLVLITSPSGTSLEGTITCRAWASDNYRVDKVKFRIDSGSWHTDSDESDGWSWVWNTNSVSDGVHTIKCRAYDARGNYQTTSKSVYVRNQGGGGGGCPILSVFDGEEYIEEGLLDIHNPDGIDVIYRHSLLSEPLPISNRYHLRLTEHHYTISHIDKVELWAELPNGEMKRLYLLSAIHSELGQVRRKLWFSDNRRVDLFGADHNDGISEFIDLEFSTFNIVNYNKIFFVIEGNNAIPKP